MVCGQPWFAVGIIAIVTVFSPLMALIQMLHPLVAFPKAPFPPLTAEITGDAPCGYAIRRAVELALPETGTAWQIAKLTMPSGKMIPGASVEAVAELQQGKGPAINVPIYITRTEVPNVPATELFVSNKPEKINGPRPLFEGLLDDGQAARLLYHHVNYSEARLLLVVELLNQSVSPAQVQLIDSFAGPSDDEIGVGHQAMWQYVARESRNAGLICTVPPMGSKVLARENMPPRLTVSGLLRLRVLTPGAAVIVRVRAASPNDGATGDYIPTTIFGDYRYFSAQMTYSGTYTAGGDWLFVPLGKIAAPALRPGQALDGCYGMTHSYELTAVNPLPDPVTIQLVVDAVAGPARLTYSLSGRWQDTDILRPGHEKVLASFRLASGASRTLNLAAIPESGSNYPVQFVLRTP